MEYQILKPGDADYPARLCARLGERAPVLYSLGPLALLNRFSLAVAASDAIPAQAMQAANQLLFEIRRYALNYIGSWHSVMETEIFRIALDRRGNGQAMRTLSLFTARGLAQESWDGFLADRFGATGPFTGFPEKEEYFRRANDGELLMLSVTEPGLKRMTRQNIVARNVAACTLADAAFVPFAEKGSKTYALTRQVLTLGIPIFTAACHENLTLEQLGVRAVTRKEVGPYLEHLGATTSFAPMSRQDRENGGPPITDAKVTHSTMAPDQFPLFAKK